MKQQNVDHRAQRNVRPYAMVGAGPLTSAIWKTGDEIGGWRYSFNVFRMSQDGRVGHKFNPRDLKDIFKLARVIAAVIADDGCLPIAERAELDRLEKLLDQLPLAEE